MTTALLTTLLLAPATVDVRVDGDGYLRFLSEGRVVYARSARLTAASGRLAAVSGEPVTPPIAVAPGGALSVGEDGTVTSGGSIAGRLTLAGGASMRARGAFFVSDTRPRVGFPGEGGFGLLAIGSVPIVRSERTTAPTETVAAANPGGPTAGRGEAIVSAESRVPGDAFTLAEVAKLQGPEEWVRRAGAVSLGASPAPGVVRTLSRSLILARLRESGFRPDQVDLVVPPRATVRRQGSSIAHAEFVAAAVDAVKRETGLDLGWTSRASGVDFEAPSGPYELVAETVSSRQAGQYEVLVSIRSSGRRLNSRTVRVEPREGVAQIRRGQAVKIVLLSGGIRVELDGKASSNGFSGQTIEVVSARNTKHQALVTGPATVEVRL